MTIRNLASSFEVTAVKGGHHHHETSESVNYMSSENEQSQFICSTCTPQPGLGVPSIDNAGADRPRDSPRRQRISRFDLDCSVDARNGEPRGAPRACRRPEINPVDPHRLARGSDTIFRRALRSIGRDVVPAAQPNSAPVELRPLVRAEYVALALERFSSSSFGRRNKRRYFYLLPSVAVVASKIFSQV
jgi:hypothetical protein